MTIPPPSDVPADPAFLRQPPAPLDGFPPEEFQERRRKLRELCPDGILLIRGATEDEFHGTVGFSQNSAFYYLTGVSTPGAFLLMLPPSLNIRVGLSDIKVPAQEILFLPGRNPKAENWTGAQLGPGEVTANLTGIQRCEDVSRLFSALNGWLRHNPLVYTLMPYGNNAKLTREYALLNHIQSSAPVVQFKDISLPIANLRMVKSQQEIERIREAIGITALAQLAAKKMIEAGTAKYEYEVEAKVLKTFRSKGAELAFHSIVGAGLHSTVLHYEKNNSPLQQGDAVVVDIGARLGNYCGDLTRTYFVGGQPTERQKEIFQLVAEAHRHAVSAYQPGIESLVSLSDKVKDFLQALPQRGKNEKGEALTMDKFMPHSLSHHLGLDVHDAGDSYIPLAPGNVITIEPGLYLPGEEIGVRLEDDYLVTESGLERLGDVSEVEW